MTAKRKSSRVKRVRGGFSAQGKRFGIVVSRFNEYLTEKLLEGAVDTLLRHGAREKDIRVVEVPGAFEIPLAAGKLIKSYRPHAVITLAVVIRGKTKHFDQVAMEAAKGVRELMRETSVPVILGILPAENASDAIERVGLKQTNKGREWAAAAIEMTSVLDQLKPAKGPR